METNDLMLRIERLEASQRRTRAFALAVSGAALALLSIAAAKTPAVSDEVRARSFVVVDETGTKRVLLGSFSGNTGLIVLGADGKKSRASILVPGDDGPALLGLQDSKGQLRAQLGVSDKGAKLAFLTPEKNMRLALDEAGGILIFDETGKPRARLNKDGAIVVDASGNGALLSPDQTEK